MLIEIHEGYIWVDLEKNVQKIDVCNIWQYVYKIVNFHFLDRFIREITHKYEI